MKRWVYKSIFTFLYEVARLESLRVDADRACFVDVYYRVVLRPRCFRHSRRLRLVSIIYAVLVPLIRQLGVVMTC